MNGCDMRRSPDSARSVQDQRVAFGKRVPKKIPVAWVGVASEVSGGMHAAHSTRAACCGL
jgi:hypothetical protein